MSALCKGTNCVPGDARWIYVNSPDDAGNCMKDYPGNEQAFGAPTYVGDGTDFHIQAMQCIFWGAGCTWGDVFGAMEHSDESGSDESNVGALWAQAHDVGHNSYVPTLNLIMDQDVPTAAFKVIIETEGNQEHTSRGVIAVTDRDYNDEGKAVDATIYINNVDYIFTRPTCYNCGINPDVGNLEPAYSVAVHECGHVLGAGDAGLLPNLDPVDVRVYPT